MAEGEWRETPALTLPTARIELAYAARLGFVGRKVEAAEGIASRWDAEENVLPTFQG